MSVFEPPVAQLVRRGVALDGDRAPIGDEDAAGAFGNEGTEQPVHRQEGEPKIEVLAHREHVDLPGLIDAELVEEPSG